MNRLTITLAIIGCGIALSSSMAMQERGHRHAKSDAAKTKDRDIAKLYELVRQARADVAVLRKAHGSERREVHRHAHGEHGEGHRHAHGEHGHREGHGEGRREGRREGLGEHWGHDRERGEHGARGGRGELREHRESDNGEEGGRRLRKGDTWDATRHGARLVLKYDDATKSFKGTVENTTRKTLSEVRVEVHLSNGRELGPTRRVNLKPGSKINVELSAVDQDFSWWTTHPEHGSEEHGHGHDGEHGHEHGAARDARPTDPALRPLYNELQLLRQDIRMLRSGTR